MWCLTWSTRPSSSTALHCIRGERGEGRGERGEGRGERGEGRGERRERGREGERGRREGDRESGSEEGSNYLYAP